MKLEPYQIYKADKNVIFEIFDNTDRYMNVAFSVTPIRYSPADPIWCICLLKKFVTEYGIEYAFLPIIDNSLDTFVHDGNIIHSHDVESITMFDWKCNENPYHSDKFNEYAVQSSAYKDFIGRTNEKEDGTIEIAVFKDDVKYILGTKDWETFSLSETTLQNQL